MKLMSPLMMFQIWGSSSMRTLRMNLPTRVTRASLAAAQTAPFFSASVRMERNL